MIWLVYALLAAVFWGMNYSLIEQVLKRGISIPALIIADSLANIALAIGLGFAAQGFSADWQVIKKGGPDLKLFFAAVAVCAIANFFIFLSIKSRNATMAGMIEIAYPLFTAFFAWLFFREVQVNAGTLAGALLIITGVCCIYTFGRAIQ